MPAPSRLNALLRKSRLAAALTLALGLTQPSTGLALAIGEINLESALNSPLEGVMVINLDRGEVIHEGELTIKLASSPDHREAGIPYPMVLKDLEIIEDQQVGRHIRFRLFSPQPINEPIISLLLDLEWNSGRLKKEITLLLDPVDYNPMRGISPENENLLRPGDYIGNTPQALRPGNSRQAAPPIFVSISDADRPAVASGSSKQGPATAPRRKITISEGEYGPVQTGDTLSQIAVVAAREVGIDVGTMMELIYDANPEAFIGSHDILVKGSTLQIPGLMPNLQDVQTMPSAHAEVVTPEYQPPPRAAHKPLLTIVGSEEEAARIMPSEDKTLANSLAQAGRGNSAASNTPEVGNSDLQKALSRIQELELANQTLANEKQAIENNLTNTQEQLGNVRNDLDRLVVEIKALSSMQAQSQQKEPGLSTQIERWLPWLLLFMTLPVALYLGLRSRPRETPVYVPAAPAPYAPEPPTAAQEPMRHPRSNPATSQTFAYEQAEDYLPEQFHEPEQDETLANEELLAAQEEQGKSLLDDESPEVDEASSRHIDPLAETMPGLSIDRNASHWDRSSVHDFDDDEDEPNDEDALIAIPAPRELPERRLQSLPSEGDTQEVIRSTLNKLEATQLIRPGEAPMEPESALDAAQEAEIYIAYDQFSLAEKTIDRLLAQDPDNDRYLLLQLKLFAETGNMDALQDLSVKLLHKHPDPHSDVNQRVRSACDKAFTQTNLRRADFSRHMAGNLPAENPDNETILEDMTAETLFVDGIEDFLDNATLMEEDELRAGPSLNDTLDGYEDDFDAALENFTEDSLGSLTTELPPHLLEERDRTEIFDDHNRRSLLSEEEEETLSEGLELPFDLESEIARYESELEDDLSKKQKP